MNEAQSMMNCSLRDNLTFDNPNLNNFTAGGNTENNRVNAFISCWDYWRDYHYPQTIIPSYPVYIQERAKDKGKEAFEIVKMLKDKRFINLEKVHDFIDIMDELIKIL